MMRGSTDWACFPGCIPPSRPWAVMDNPFGGQRRCSHRTFAQRTLISDVSRTKGTDTPTRWITTLSRIVLLGHFVNRVADFPSRGCVKRDVNTFTDHNILCCKPELEPIFPLNQANSLHRQHLPVTFAHRELGPLRGT